MRNGSGYIRSLTEPSTKQWTASNEKRPQLSSNISIFQPYLDACAAALLLKSYGPS